MTVCDAVRPAMGAKMLRHTLGTRVASWKDMPEYTLDSSSSRTPFPGESEWHDVPTVNMRRRARMPVVVSAVPAIAVLPTPSRVGVAVASVVFVVAALMVGLLGVL